MEMETIVPLRESRMEDRDPTTMNCGAVTRWLKTIWQASRHIPIGTGLLSIPFAFAKSGLLVGIIGTLSVGFTCTHCSSIVVKCAQILCERTRRTEMSFVGVVETAFATGPRWSQKFSGSIKFLTQILLIIAYLGAMSVDIVVITKNCSKVLEFYNKGINERLLMAYLLLPLILICWIPNLKYLALLNMVGNGIMGVSLKIIFFYLVKNFQSLNKIPLTVTLNDLPYFFGITVFTMQVIGVIMPLEKNTNNPQNFIGILGILKKGLFGLTVILMGFWGSSAYLDRTEETITLNIPIENVLVQAVNVMISLAVFLNVGLQFHFCMDIVWIAVGNLFKTRPTLSNYVMRTVLVTLAVLLAVGVPKIAPLIALIGALCFSILGLLMPVLIETITCWDTAHRSRNCMVIKNSIISILGLVILVAGSSRALSDILKIDSGESV